MENPGGVLPVRPAPPAPAANVRVYGMTTADSILAEFLRRTPGSAAESRRARAVLPLGVSSNFRYYDPYPLVIARGQGCRLWDVDGHGYIDYNLAQGTMVVGYAHPEIVRAVEAAAASGSMFSLPAESDRRMAELLCARFPVDQVRFTTTGSEAVMYALRLARGVTGRDAFIRFEGAYHGTYDPLLGGFRPRPEHAGPIEAPR
ncbi:MAG TPA: aminotransferase class III-fold pyridoxal phosphate-dependent enzyme, partial [Candidatus Polarisedimenticolia bacterium]|nr:aminotransferase class III-fold pyridoxal phosphate-dependent enzyme [Candidatus Polarisedimenticolia bacterium]